MRGRVVTFYSFKGGVGRSMALVNSAVLLAAEGHSVLVMDFDLDAPGLHRYLRDAEDEDRQHRGGATQAGSEQVGVVEFFLALQERLRDEDGAAAREGPGTSPSVAKIVVELLTSHRYTQDLCLNRKGSAALQLSFMPAGRMDERYAERVQGIAWREIFEREPALFTIVAEALRERFDYVLVDARTGLTDIGSVCTVLLPDVLVLAFVPNWQSLAGVLEVGEQSYRQNPSLSLVPLLLRVEDAEHEDRDRWIARARERFESLFEELYQLPRCDLSAYFEDVRVSHESYYAYGERIAALLDPSRTGMTRAFSQLLPFLSGHPPWAARALRPPPQGRGMLRALIACADVDMDARVMPLLRRLVRLGIRSQITAQEGFPWSDLVEQAATRPRDLVVLAFWSQEAQTDPMFLERYAQALRQGVKPISVQLDVGAPRTYAHAPGVLPEPGFSPPSFLSAQDEAHLVILIARHVFRQTELDRREDLVLYLGHRQSQSDPLLPVAWRHLPALDMRADLLGSRDFCPTLTEWRQIREDAQALKDLLPAARNLYVCGLAPLGVGAIIGHTWDRGTGVTLLTHARSPDSGDQEWSSSLTAADLEATGVWEPERGEQIRLAPGAEPIRAAHLLLALLPAARAEYISNVRRWNETRGAPYSAVEGEGPAPLLWLQTPIAITKPTQMRDVLRETLGALHFLRRTYPFISRIDLVTALPLAAVSLLGHHLRQFGEVNFYDQVLATAEYRLAVQFH